MPAAATTAAGERSRGAPGDGDYSAGAEISDTGTSCHPCCNREA